MGNNTPYTPAQIQEMAEYLIATGHGTRRLAKDFCEGVPIYTSNEEKLRYNAYAVLSPHPNLPPAIVLGEGLLETYSPEMILFICYHEWAHIMLGHTCSTHENEYAADAYATTYLLLNGVPQAIQAFLTEARHWIEAETHPSGWYRVLRAIDTACWAREQPL